MDSSFVTVNLSRTFDALTLENEASENEASEDIISPVDVIERVIDGHSVGVDHDFMVYSLLPETRGMLLGQTDHEMMRIYAL